MATSLKEKNHKNTKQQQNNGLNQSLNRNLKPARKKLENGGRCGHVVPKNRTSARIPDSTEDSPFPSLNCLVRLVNANDIWNKLRPYFRLLSRRAAAPLRIP